MSRRHELHCGFRTLECLEIIIYWGYENYADHLGRDINHKFSHCSVVDVEKADRTRGVMRYVNSDKGTRQYRRSAV